MVTHNGNINPNNINILDVVGDGSCLYRCISCFIYGTEELHQRVRIEIYNEAIQRVNNYPEITIETEEGPMLIRE